MLTLIALLGLAEAAPPVTQSSYILNSDELTLIKFLEQNCTGGGGEHPGTCKIVITDDGWATVTPPTGEPIVNRLNGGNPIRHDGYVMGCSDRSVSVVSCTIALNHVMSSIDMSMDGKPFISLKNFRTGTEISFETENYLVTDSGVLQSM